jgi:hypothetical protein
MRRDGHKTVQVELEKASHEKQRAAINRKQKEEYSDDYRGF